MARRIVLGTLAVLTACGRDAVAAAQPYESADAGADGSAQVHEDPGPRLEELEIVAARSMKRARLVLARDEAGNGTLFVEPYGADPAAIPCDPLPGAWGLWVDDIDGDGAAEAIVALRKRAPFDPKPENRLYVLGFEAGRCVPAWRGTRLAGRFEALTVEPDRPGTLLVRERVGVEQYRVARYRWNDFGYRVQDVLWQGNGTPPDRFDELLQGPP